MMYYGWMDGWIIDFIRLCNFQSQVSGTKQPTYCRTGIYRLQSRWKISSGDYPDSNTTRIDIEPISIRRRRRRIDIGPMSIRVVLVYAWASLRIAYIMRTDQLKIIVLNILSKSIYYENIKFTNFLNFSKNAYYENIN